VPFKQKQNKKKISHFFENNFIVIGLGFWVARFLLVQNTKTGKIYQNDHKVYQIISKYTKCP
jgi:hypothetical protein